MITEDYCSFEIAKMLKEKGFDELSRFYYFEPRQSPEMFPSQREHRNTDKVYGENTLIAPTHQMAMKWLREKQIYIRVVEDAFGKSYRFEIYSKNPSVKIDYYIPNYYQDTYEDAVEAALKYVLENLI